MWSASRPGAGGGSVGSTPNLLDEPKGSSGQSQAARGDPLWFPSCELASFPLLDSSIETSSHARLPGHRSVTFFCEKCGEKHQVPLRCGDRCCPVCRGKDYRRLLEGYLESVKRIHRPKLMTLTLRNVEDLNRSYVRWVRKCFTRLMRRAYYRRLVKGGLCAFEITNRGRGFHVHLHIILSADFIPVRKLSHDWSGVTGGSGVVDIRAISGAREALAYCLKYLSKPPALKGKDEAISDEELEERREVYRAAVRGVRLVQAFGSLYDELVLEIPELKCKRCGGSRWIIWEFELAGEFYKWQKDKGG